MAERVFCIDLGSSYTKVAVRRDPTAEGELVRDKFSAVGEAEFCIPSVVAVDKTSTPRKVECGYEAAARSQGAEFDVYSDWKKRVFSVADPDTSAVPPLTALLQSPDFLSLAEKFEVSQAHIRHLQTLVTTAQALAGEGNAALAAARHRTQTGLIAVHFFKFLRRTILEACAPLRVSGLDPDKFPVRLAVPAFGQGRDLQALPGCQLLLESLGKAGWSPHPTRPLVSEPYSNAIGVLTKGENALLKTRKLHFPKMFGTGPLLTVINDPVKHPAFRVLVIDVGAFTTDFATVNLKPNDDKVFDLDAEFTFTHDSVRLGVSQLESLFWKAVSPEKQAWARSAQIVELDRLRRSIFSEGRAYRTVEVGAIGGATDAPAVRGSLDDFTKQLQEAATRFCGSHEPVELQELILTGGGNSIPAVREALIKAVQSSGQSFFRIHAPGIRKDDVACRITNLKDDMTRGGSALGGASIFFESEYN